MFKEGKVEFRMLQILDENGISNEKLMPNLTNDQIIEMYKFMVLSRKYDDKAMLMQRQGKLGTYAPVLGQEASQVGSAYALEENDWLIPTFRESAALITRNIPLYMLYQYWNGYEDGQKFPDDSKILPISIPIASQITHGVGCAWASKIKKESSATLIYFGDGATSEGEFHEGLNFAGVYNTPCVFICQNNQWAISTPRVKQTASRTIAQKAEAYGFEGIIVDGNDIFAVYKSVKGALDKAREGKGPTLIECMTYRMSVHTTSDDPTKYRMNEEVEIWKKKDPIVRLKRYMINKKIWNNDQEKKLAADSDEEVKKAVKILSETPKGNPDDMFRYVFADLPKHLKDQMEYQKLFSNNEE